MTPTRPVLIAAAAALVVALGAFAFVMFQLQPTRQKTVTDASVETDVARSVDAQNQVALVPVGSTESADVASTSAASDDAAVLDTNPTVAESSDLSAEPIDDTPSVDAATDQPSAEADAQTPPSSEAVSSAATPEGWQSYANTLYGYGFDVPADWYKDAETTPTGWVAAFTSFNPATSTNVNDVPGVKVEVLVQENTEGSSLDQLADAIALQASHVRSRTDVTLGGKPAKRIVADLPSGPAMIVVGLRDTDVFTVSFTGRDVTDREETFNTLLTSFVF